MLLVDTEHFLQIMKEYPASLSEPFEEPVELTMATLAEAISKLEKEYPSRKDMACALFEVLPLFELEDFLVINGALLLYGVYDELSFPECFAVVYARLDHRTPSFLSKACNEAYSSIPESN